MSRDRGWLLGYAVLAAVLFAPLLFGGQTLYFDDTGHLYWPARDLVFAEIRAGRLPLWSPLVGAGYPLLAEGQAGGLYPGNLLAWLLDTPAALSGTVFAHAWIAAALMHGFLRELGCRAVAAAVGSVSFMLSGAYVGHLVYLSMAFSLVWLPGVLWGLSAGARRGDGRPFLLAAGALALSHTAVHAQMAAYVGLVSLAWGAMLIAGAAGRRRALIGRLAMTFLLAGLLAAPVLVGMLELTGLSARAATLDRSLLTEYALSPLRVLFLFTPHLFGHPTREVSTQWANLTVPWELAAYVGVPAVVLLLAAPLISRRRATWALAALAWGCFLLAWGRALPLFELLHGLPVMQSFRIPARWLVPGSVACAALAGLAADALARADTPRPRLLPAGLLIPLAAVLLLAYLAIDVHRQRGRIDAEQVRWAWVCAAWCAGLWLVSGALVVARPRWAVPVLLGLLVIDLVVIQRTYNPLAPPEVFRDDPLSERVAARLGPGERVFFPPWKGPRLLQPVTNAAMGVAAVDNFVPLKLRGVDTILEEWKQQAEPQRARSTRDRWLLAARQGVAAVDAERARRRVAWLRRLRVRVTLPAYGPLDGRPDADGLVWLDELAPPAWSANGHRVPWAAPTGSRMVLGPARGVVTVSSAAHPGWRAMTPDREPRPVGLAEGVLLAVDADGPTRLVFAPLSLRLGLFVGLAALAGGMATWRATDRR